MIPVSRDCKTGRSNTVNLILITSIGAEQTVLTSYYTVSYLSALLRLIIQQSVYLILLG